MQSLLSDFQWFSCNRKVFLAAFQKIFLELFLGLFFCFVLRFVVGLVWLGGFLLPFLRRKNILGEHIDSATYSGVVHGVSDSSL